jgi:hypothetical protein
VKKMLTVLILLVMAGCARHPPETVCIRSHHESGLQLVPITVMNGNTATIVLQPMYYEDVICDASRYTTQEEKDAFCKEYTCEKN